ncbi:MAG: aspartate carbamoyltransferase regulatory subunit [Patescibacteria group bacterium]
MKNTPSKTLSVSAIKDGTVIDHVASGRALQIIRVLNLSANNQTVTVGLNLPSRAMGHKDLIKVEGLELSADEANRVAILAPEATMNIIKNYEVVKKFPVTIPEIIERLIACPNPACITNNEPMPTKFFVLNQKKKLQLSCAYCEKKFEQSEIKIN